MEIILILKLFLNPVDDQNFHYFVMEFNIMAMNCGYKKLSTLFCKQTVSNQATEKQ